MTEDKLTLDDIAALVKAARQAQPIGGLCADCDFGEHFAMDQAEPLAAVFNAALDPVTGWVATAARAEKAEAELTALRRALNPSGTLDHPTEWWVELAQRYRAREPKVRLAAVETATVREPAGGGSAEP